MALSSTSRTIWLLLVCFPFQDTKRFSFMRFSFMRFSIYANMGVYKGHLSEKCKPLALLWLYLVLNQRDRGMLHCLQW